MSHAPEDPNPDGASDKMAALPELPADLSTVSPNSLSMLWQALPHIVVTFVRNNQIDDARAAVRQQDRLIAWAEEMCDCPACTKAREAAGNAEEQATAAIAVASCKRPARAPDGSLLN